VFQIKNAAAEYVPELMRQSQSPFGFIGVSDGSGHGGGKAEWRSGSQSPFGFIGVSDYPNPDNRRSKRRGVSIAFRLHRCFRSLVKNWRNWEQGVCRSQSPFGFIGVSDIKGVSKRYWSKRVSIAFRLHRCFRFYIERVSPPKSIPDVSIAFRLHRCFRSGSDFDKGIIEQQRWSQSPFGFIGVSDLRKSRSAWEAVGAGSQSPFGFIGVSDIGNSTTGYTRASVRSQSPFGFIGVSDGGRYRDQEGSS